MKWHTEIYSEISILTLGYLSCLIKALEAIVLVSDSYLQWLAGLLSKGMKKLSWTDGII